MEASFRPATAKVAMVVGRKAAGSCRCHTNYRVRYSATGMDRAQQRDACWPASRCRTDTCWFGPLVSSGRGHSRDFRPARRPTGSHVAAAAPQERADSNSGEAAQEQASGRRLWPPRRAGWGGRLPDKRVRRTNGAMELARLDRPLLDGITGLHPATQRAVAVWAARRACAAAGLTGLDWVKPALAALDVALHRSRARRFACFAPIPLRTTTCASTAARTHSPRRHAGTMVRRGPRPAGGRADPVPRDGHGRDRLPAPPVRGARDALPELAEVDPDGGRRRPSELELHTQMLLPTGTRTTHPSMRIRWISRPRHKDRQHLRSRHAKLPTSAVS